MYCNTYNTFNTFNHNDRINADRNLGLKNMQTKTEKEGEKAKKHMAAHNQCSFGKPEDE